MPDVEAAGSVRRPTRIRLLVLLTVAAAAAVFAAANAHLVYVAIASQPECVTHAKTGEAGPGAFSAAKSAC